MKTATFVAHPGNMYGDDNQTYIEKRDFNLASIKSELDIEIVQTQSEPAYTEYFCTTFWKYA